MNRDDLTFNKIEAHT